MSKLYKLTDQHGRTHGGTQWGVGVTHTADGQSKELCNGHWIHAYRDPYVAVLLNPAHAAFTYPRLWECRGKVGLDMADKCGCTELTTVREIALPKVTQPQAVEFARLVALRVYPLWREYDKDGIGGRWLHGDKSISAADAVWAATRATWATEAAAAATAATAAAAAAAATWAAATAAAADAAEAAEAITWRQMRNDARKACGAGKA